MPARDKKQFDLSWIRDRRLTIDEMMRYKNETSLPPCLVCGRKLRYLSSHLTTHGMTMQEYRDFYGIPRFMSICDKEVSESKSKISAELYDAGIICLEKWTPEKAALARAVPRRLNRPEIKTILAIDNCAKINRGKDGNLQRVRKLNATHTKEETAKILRERNIFRNSHKTMNEANERRGWVKSKEHEARRIEVMQLRATIVRMTPPDQLPEALAKFKDECRIERNRRIYEKRRAKINQKRIIDEITIQTPHQQAHADLSAS